jgi:hypothetical protein
MHDRVAANGDGQCHGEPGAGFAAGRGTERAVERLQASRGPGMGIDKLREPLAEDRAGAARVFALESAGDQPHNERSVTERQIGDGPVIPAVDPLGNRAAEWAARRNREGRGGDDEKILRHGQIGDAEIALGREQKSSVGDMAASCRSGDHCRTF